MSKQKAPNFKEKGPKKAKNVAKLCKKKQSCTEPKKIAQL